MLKLCSVFDFQTLTLLYVQALLLKSYKWMVGWISGRPYSKSTCGAKKDKSNGKVGQSLGQTFEDVGLISWVECCQNIQTDGCKQSPFQKPSSNFSHITQFCCKLLKSQFCLAVPATPGWRKFCTVPICNWHSPDGTSWLLNALKRMHPINL